MSAASAAGRPHLEVIGVSKTYATRKGEVQALAAVDLRAARGEFVSIAGPSGCGKSTLLKIVLGVVAASGGRILIDGKPTEGPQTAVGMVFQTPALPPWRTVLDNVLLPAQVLGHGKAAYRDRARELLSMAGLAGFEDKYPAELSGGMQQRVSICRALIHDPQLLLMDEPFGALDALTRESMQNALLEIWRRTGKTIVLVTHSIDEAILLSNRILVMSARPGRIVEEIEVDLENRFAEGTRESAAFQAYARRLRRGLNQLAPG